MSAPPFLSWAHQQLYEVIFDDEDVAMQELQRFLAAGGGASDDDIHQIAVTKPAQAFTHTEPGGRA